MLAHSEKNTGRPSQDPFCISEGDLVARAIKTFGFERDGEYGSARGLEARIGNFRQRNQVNRDRALKEFWWRFGPAIFVSLSMIGPMLLMVFHKSVATNLATTSVAVVLVAATIAWFAQKDPETVMGVVAAYTAVLVVFVGTLET